MMLALVVVVWACLLVAICSDAVEVWLTHKLDRAHRARWAEDWGTDYETPHEQAQRVGARVYCNCGGCCEWRARKLGLSGCVSALAPLAFPPFRSERLTPQAEKEPMRRARLSRWLAGRISRALDGAWRRCDGLAMPSQATPSTQPATRRGRVTHTPEETAQLYRVASMAWSDVRDALAEGQRSPSGRFGDAFTQRKLREAMRGKPDFVTLRSPQEGGAVALAPFDMSPDAAPDAVAGSGYDAADQYEQDENAYERKRLERETPRERRERLRRAREVERQRRIDERLRRMGFEVGNDPAPGSADEAALWSRAATLLRQLRDITARAHEGARTGATEAARDIAAMTENGITAIVRPLGTALGEATRPLAENAGQGLGFGLAVVVGLLLISKAK